VVLLITMRRAFDIAPNGSWYSSRKVEGLEAAADTVTELMQLLLSPIWVPTAIRFRHPSNKFSNFDGWYPGACGDAECAPHVCTRGALSENKACSRNDLQVGTIGGSYISSHQRQSTRRDCIHKKSR
jgi:hypothetical protein